MRPVILLGSLVLVAAACSGDTPAVPTTTSAPGTVGTTSTTVPAATSTPEPTTATTTGTTTTLPPPPPLGDVHLDLELVSDGFEQPVLVTSRPGDDRLIVLEQGGRVVALDPGSGEVQVVLAIEDLVRWSGEQGLLGLAFDPQDPDRFIVHYSAGDGSTMVSAYEIDPATGVADPGSARQILTIPQPARNHNGGMIAFGPDGYLYIGLGDGGGANDVYDNGQNPFSLLGAILRIDPVDGDPYAIPPGNPFADGEEGAPEVWAWGLRNPWRFAFDGTDLWVGDVGQGAWEEIDLFDADRPGDNAGWPLLEGTHCFRIADCDPGQFLAPVTEYSHGAGRCSVTGGAVYRGAAIPHLAGTYLYGDYCTGEIWGLRLGDEVEERLFTGDGGLPSLPGLTSFGVGPGGEMYVMQADGHVWRFVPGA